MDAHKAKRKELDNFHDTFETDEEAIEERGRRQCGTRTLGPCP